LGSSATLATPPSLASRQLFSFLGGTRQVNRRIPLFLLGPAALVASAIGCAHGVDPVDPDAVEGSGGRGGTSGSISGSGNTPSESGGTVNGSGAGSSVGGSSGGLPGGGGTPSPGSGGGSSGSPSSGGTAAGGGAGAGAGGAVVDPILPGDVVVQYMPGASNDNGSIRPHFSVVNRGQKLVPLAQITIRYWYTADGPTSSSNYQELMLDYAEVGRLTSGRTTVVLSFKPVMPPQPNADTYLEVGFKGPDSIGPGQMTVDKTPFLETKQIETAAHWPGYNPKYDQTNDYSYATKTTYVDWPKVTLYQNGVLVWGTEPDGTMPSGMSPGDAGATPSPSPSDAGPG
jgi:cellulose 1,4-beta-cellobiosidase